MKSQFDVIIVGGSYSGLAAGMALGRALRNVLIIDSGNPCNKQTPHSHNFLTHDGKTPKEITALAKQQVSMYDTVDFLDGVATSAIRKENGFEVQIHSGEKFSARKLVFATGVKDLMPDIPGVAACWGISVLHCPYCHGYEVKHQPTGILANNDTAFELSSLISNWTKDLSVFTNGKSTLTEHQGSKLDSKKIKFVEDDIEQLTHNNGYITDIVFKNGKKASVKAIYTRLPFEQHSDIPESLGCGLTKDGYIEVDPIYKTTVAGVYACGDNIIRMRSVANAVAMGTTTGAIVNKEMIDEDF